MALSLTWYNVLLFVAMAMTSQKSANGKSINSYAGPYLAYVDRFYNGESSDHQIPWKCNGRITHFNPQKPNELQLMTLKITGVNVTLDDTCWIKVVLDIRANNQWKANAFIFSYKDNACQKFKANIPDLFRLVTAKLDTSVVCSLPPDVYEFADKPVKWIFPNVPVMIYGTYKFNIFIGGANDRKLYAMFVAETRVIPKVK